MEGAEGDTLPKGPLREKAPVNSQNVPCEVLLYESELVRYSNKYFLFHCCSNWPLQTGWKMATLLFGFVLY
ncbi:hypothetical protein U0070_002671 [Myodes glareolus]|uniref:Uncharacterized protein n=1 Tax=Myodes glareolus TaxID=447135 RepID=A0AAW0H1T4_MYOGA